MFLRPASILREVDYLGVGRGKCHDLLIMPNREELAFGNRDGGRVRIAAVKGREPAVAED
ncbi:MAG: hypothetical protein KK478_20390 [Ensifer alkalisoli]|nr:hypothetical protein [Sinorhizobium alkalisoli]